MSDPLNDAKVVFYLENEIETLNDVIRELREYIAVLEGDLADMRMAVNILGKRPEVG